MVLASVAVILQPPVAPFELGVLHEVFGIDRTPDGVPAFRFRVCAADPGAGLPAGGGLTVLADSDLTACESADLVAVPSGTWDRSAPPAVLDQVRRAADRGATVLGMCSGLFTLAQAGVLDGAAAAVHWRYASRLRDTHPEVAVDQDSLYHVEGPVVTTAGTAAGIDACLHLVRREYGSRVANRIARRMVVPPHRDGGQLQFVEHPLPADADSLGLQPLLDWIEENLHLPLSLAALASHAHTSPRTLTRRFRDEVGAAPMAWVTSRRLAFAQELLEATTLPVDEVARRAGFVTDATLRHHFRIHLGVAPTTYRRKFATTPR